MLRSRFADGSLIVGFINLVESLDEAINQQNGLPKTRVETRVKTEDQILTLLGTHPQLSLADVAATIGRSLSAVERAVAKLKNQNRLEYEGSKKSGRWRVID